MSTDAKTTSVAELISNVAHALADAQMAFDQSSTKVAELFSGRTRLEDGAVVDTRVPFGYTYENGKRIPQRLSMFELGFVPHFYQFVENVVDLKVCMRIAPSRNGKTEGFRLISTPVDASYQNTYGIKSEQCSRLAFQIRPVPPPSELVNSVDLLNSEEETRESEYHTVASAIQSRVPVALIESLSTETLKGLGKKAGESLSKMGVDTIAQLREWMFSSKANALPFTPLEYAAVRSQLLNILMESELSNQSRVLEKSEAALLSRDGNTLIKSVTEWIVSAESIAEGVIDDALIAWCQQLTLCLDKSMLDRVYVQQMGNV
ncbi:hypothetical protein [Marinibactrum halimedae]|uniref:Uncharacterized protein n=1 Tax=Marinibactrum halimedae TaxID=1444977 RepID=A0AA37WM01_9GAMM|nr:hypothetical protein [Marinibactrum halimedae]MCD9460279.1 hypothetical protein [Marinibactrum halimedae]GLS24366.1 hypothetical protein GCM10007877_00770 [Marinibactrum halimedae]